MSLNNELPGRTAGPYTPLYEKYSVCFGGDIRARQLERSIGGLQAGPGVLCRKAQLT